MTDDDTGDERPTETYLSPIPELGEKVTVHYYSRRAEGLSSRRGVVKDVVEEDDLVVVLRGEGDDHLTLVNHTTTMVSSKTAEQFTRLGPAVAVETESTDPDPHARIGDPMHYFIQTVAGYDGVRLIDEFDEAFLVSPDELRTYLKDAREAEDLLRIANVWGEHMFLSPRLVERALGRYLYARGDS